MRRRVGYLRCTGTRWRGPQNGGRNLRMDRQTRDCAPSQRRGTGRAGSFGHWLRPPRLTRMACDPRGKSRIFGGGAPYLWVKMGALFQVLNAKSSVAIRSIVSDSYGRRPGVRGALQWTDHLPETVGSVVDVRTPPPAHRRCLASPIRRRRSGRRSRDIQGGG
jgi:hypothetical protein